MTLTGGGGTAQGGACRAGDPNQATRWTKEQLAALTTTGADVLVSASAGTGKTAVLVERVIRRILGGPDAVDVDRLLVVTFTESAAAEMRERILRALLARSSRTPDDERLQRQLALLPRAQISTIHSFCLALVREHFYALGLDPEVRVIDEHEAQLLMLEVLDRVFEARYEAEDRAFLDLVDRYAGDRGDEALRRMVIELHGYARGLPDLRRWLRSAVEALDPVPGEGFGRTAWGKELAAALGATARHAVRLLDDALERCAVPDGPSEYRDVLLGEREAFATIERAALAGDWPGVVAGARRPEKTRLPQSRGSSETSRVLARSARDEAWRQFGRLRTVARPEDELLAELREVRAPVETLAGLVVELDDLARERRAARGLLDFADLEYYALQLLEAPDGTVARKLRRRYAEVFVDEYQDINAVQYRLLDLISRGNLFAIGDLKQSIYRFRGTDPGFFRRRREESTEVDPERDGAPVRAAPGGADAASRRGGPIRWCIALTRNFRSRRAVIDAVNFVFSELMRVELAETDYGPRERLRPGFDYGGAPDGDAPVEVYVLERARRGGPGAGEDPAGDAASSPVPEAAEDGPAVDELEREAELVARRILRMVRGAGSGRAEFFVYHAGHGGYRPVAYRDVAVLLRVVQGRANRYLDTFARLGVPVRANLSTGYFSAVEVETMLALLRVIDNPRQDIPLAAVLRSPVVGLDERELAAVRGCATDGPYFEAVKAAALAPPAGAAGLSERLASFLDRLSSWRTAARRGPLSDLVWELLQDTGYLGFVGGLAGGAQRQANLLALHDRAREFDRFARQGLARFLRFIEQLHESESDLGAVGDPAEGPDAVLLTSIHKSKGLEFPVVFLPDLGRQFRPRGSADVLWHAELGLGPVLADREKGYKYPTAAWHAVDARLAREELAEEMRLLYVGMTRARERLVVSGSVRDLQARAEAWAATSGRGALIPESALRTDRTYLDWLCRALARHPCGGALRGETSCSAAAAGGPPAPGDPSRWHLVLIPQRTELGDGLFPEVETEPEVRDAGAPVSAVRGGLTPEQWARVRSLEPLGLAVHERLAAFDRVAGWRYPAAGRTRVPAKESVSRLTRRLARLAAAGDGADPVRAAGPAAPAPAEFRAPELRPWAGRRTPTAAELGTIVHEVLSSLDLSGPHDAGSLSRQGLAMERAGVLAEGESRFVCWDDLAWFFGTPLGHLLSREQAAVRREVPFSLAVSAVEVFGRELGREPGRPDAADGLQDELVLVQGMIDCLIDLPSGPVILDFKTDRVSPAETDARTRVYAPQVALYARAVRESLGVPVAEAWIVFLRARACRLVGTVHGQA